MDAGRVIMDGTPKIVFSEVEKIRALGMDVPIAADIAAILRAKGISLQQGIITDEELAAALCP